MKKLILLLLLTLPTTKYTACDNITTNLIALDQSLAKLKRTTKKLPKTPTKKTPTKKSPTPKSPTPKKSPPLLEEIKKGKKLKQTIPTIESCTKKLDYTIKELTTDQKNTINNELQEVIKNLENTNDSLKRMLKMYQKMPYEKNREATWTYVITKLLENTIYTKLETVQPNAKDLCLALNILEPKRGSFTLEHITEDDKKTIIKNIDLETFAKKSNTELMPLIRLIPKRNTELTDTSTKSIATAINSQSNNDRINEIKKLTISDLESIATKEELITLIKTIKNKSTKTLTSKLTNYTPIRIEAQEALKIFISKIKSEKPETIINNLKEYKGNPMGILLSTLDNTTITKLLEKRLLYKQVSLFKKYQNKKNLVTDDILTKFVKNRKKPEQKEIMISTLTKSPKTLNELSNGKTILTFILSLDNLQRCKTLDELSNEKLKDILKEVKTSYATKEDPLKKEFETIKKYRPVFASYTKDIQDSKKTNQYKSIQLPKGLWLPNITDKDKKTLQNPKDLEYTNFIPKVESSSNIDEDWESGSDSDEDWEFE